MTGFNWYINSTIIGDNVTDFETAVGPASDAMAYEMPAMKEKGINTHYYVSPSAIRCYAIHPGNNSGTTNANAVWGPILMKMRSFPNMTPFQAKAFSFVNYNEYFDASYGALADPLAALADPYNQEIFPRESRLLSAEHLRSPNIT